MNSLSLKTYILLAVMLLVKYSSARSNVISDTLIKPGAQSNITFDAGQVFSTYKFIDDKGIKLTGLSSTINGCFSLGYRYVLPNGLFIPAAAGLRKAGASMVYEGLTINWNVQYADAAIGLGYMFNNKNSHLKRGLWGIKPYFALSPYFGYTLKANQQIGTDTYDIKKNKAMKTSDFGLYLSSGLQITVSKYIDIYTEYKYILGLKNIEPAADEKLFNRGFSISLGIAIKPSRPPFPPGMGGDNR